MKIRLTQAGFAKYTGQMGVIFFENGESVGDVSVIDATRLAAVMKCEWENGTPANVGQIYLDNMKTPAPVQKKITPVLSADVIVEDMTATSGLDAARCQKIAEAVKKVASAIEVEATAAVRYTEQQLAEIADNSGIAGLREIADPLGIKGNSIRLLIEEILKVK